MKKSEKSYFVNRGGRIVRLLDISLLNICSLRNSRRLLIHINISIRDFFSNSRNPILIKSPMPLDHSLTHSFTIILNHLRLQNPVHAVRVLNNLGDIPPTVNNPPEASIQGPLVKNDSVFNIVPRVTHNGHTGIVAGRHLIIVHEFDGLGHDERLLGVYQQVADGVCPPELVEGESPDGLLAHSALVGVSGGLVVVGVGDDPRYQAKQGVERDFEVGGVLLDLGRSINTLRLPL